MRFAVTYGLATAFLSFLPATLFAQTPEEDPDPAPQAAFELGAKQVDPFYGTLATRVPIATPAFRGLEPRLALQYNSASGNGYLGAGWSLDGISTIELMSRNKGAPTYGFYGTALEDAYFLDGQELLPCTPGMASPSCTSGGTHTTKSESFLRVRWQVGGTFPPGVTGSPSTPSFRVTRPDGTELLYLPILSSSGPTPTRFGLTWIGDRRGNAVFVHWGCGLVRGIECYPVEIDYSATSIFFDWEPRPDPIRRAVGGLETTLMAARLRTIDVFVGTQRARLYRMSYESSRQTGESVLSRVQQFGSDAVVGASGAVTGTSLPPIDLIRAPDPGQPVHELGDLETWATAPFFAAPSSMWTGDFDGDGKEDFLYVDVSRVAYHVLRSDGDTFHPDEVWAPFVTVPDWRAVFVADLDDDGRDDILYANNPSGYWAALSTGTSFAAPVKWADYVPPTMFDAIHPLDWSAVWLRDMNGDGRPDLVYAAAMPALGIYVALGTGSGFGPPTLWSGVPIGWPMSAKQVHLADFNGDAKTDVLYLPSSLSNLVVMLSTGEGFVAPYDWGTFDIPIAHTSALRTADFNGDGKTDLLILDAAFSAFYVRLSGGNNFLDAELWAPYEGVAHLTFGLWTPDLNADGRADLMYSIGLAGSYRAALSTSEGFGAATTWGDRPGLPHLGQVWIRDFSGDGAADLMQTTVSANVLLVATNRGRMGDTLYRTMGNGLGGSATVEVSRSRGLSPANAVPWMYLVDRITVDDGRGGLATTSFSYSGGRYDHRERRFLGFAQARRTLPCIAGELACPYEDLWFRQDLPAAGRPDRFERRDGAGQLLLRTEHSYDTRGGVLPWVALETRTDEIEYAGAASRRVRVERTYDGFGNVSQQIEHGDVAVTGDERTTRTERFANTSAYLVSYPAQQEVYAGAGTGGALLSRARYRYDGAASHTTPPSVGNRTAEERWIDTTASWAIATTTYDAHGNPIVQIDPNGVRTDIAWDPVLHLYEANRRNALGHLTQFQWDPVCGVKRLTVDPNGQTTTTSYDVLCRPTRTDRPLGGFTENHYLSIGAVGSQRVRVETPGPAGHAPIFEERYFDGLGRIFRTLESGGTGAEVIAEDVAYNARGQEQSRSLPYVVGETAPLEVFAHDARDRRVRTAHPDLRSTQILYGVGTVTQIDELGHQVVEERDAYGQTTRTRAMHDGVEVITDLRHDAKGRLVGIVDHHGNEWSYAYDSADRRILEDDPDLGARVKSYDAGGRLIATVDAKGQRVELGYDLVGREITKTVGAGSPAPVVYRKVYDQFRPGAFNVGRLTGLVDPEGEQILDYDAAGRVVTETRVLAGQSFTFQRSYDAGGRLLFERYPDGDSFGSAAAPLRYDAAGRLAVVPGIVDEARYLADGQLLEQRNSNGTRTLRGYASPRRFLTSIQTTKGALTLQSLGYTRDDEGKITRVLSPFEHERWSYSYDDLHRLVLAKSDTAPSDSEHFVYDEIGRLIERSRVGCYSYPTAGAPRPHGVTHAGGHSYSYDPNGNMITWGARGLTWDAEDRLVAIDGDTYRYDAAGERLSRTIGGETTLTPRPDYEIGPTGTVTKHLRLGAELVAKRVGATTYWLHTDHLGSIQLITDRRGHQVQRAAYRPYGERLERLTSHEESKGYIGEAEDDSGLLYLHARYYDPALGRFLSADTYDPLDSGVGLDRFAYALGDPIGKLDRSGHDATGGGVLKDPWDDPTFVRSGNVIDPSIDRYRDLGACLFGRCLGGDLIQHYEIPKFLSSPATTEDAYGFRKPTGPLAKLWVHAVSRGVVFWERIENMLGDHSIDATDIAAGYLGIQGAPNLHRNLVPQIGVHSFDSVEAFDEKYPGVRGASAFSRPVQEFLRTFPRDPQQMKALEERIRRTPVATVGIRG